MYRNDQTQFHMPTSAALLLISHSVYQEIHSWNEIAGKGHFHT